MKAHEIQLVIEQSIPTKLVIVDSNDDVHFEATVISSVFEGLTLLKRQQLVYKTLGDLISTGKVHALSLKTFTSNEWAKRD
ncbi:MAG: BolA/IbaG family iron-sulfur metabolism protein [Gammaproteobacteria bacterium]|nr:BolA/IbaG family iron-sulfur metabolism protein [Gammaproteobacteria bacterium]